MSLSLPRRRRLLSSAVSLLQSQPHFLPSTHPCCYVQSRSISNPFPNPFKRQNQEPSQLSPASIEKARQEKAASKRREQTAPKPGDLAPGSIFDEEPPSTRSPLQASPNPPRDPHAMAAALDPTPHARRRWQRKMLIRDIRGRHRLNKTEKILRTERQHLSKSPFIKTSVKKLYPLARQIAGKPLEEAMVQMRFSKKKAAKDVLEHLMLARDEAVVARGMGLGKVESKLQQQDQEQQTQQEGEADTQTQTSEPHNPRLIVEDKKGKKRTVTDPTAMYIDEAWVGRGKYESGSDHRARGQIHRLRLPYTSISVVLKEEKTRIRLMEEREAERQRRRVWVPLVDRKITAQRQFCLW